MHRSLIFCLVIIFSFSYLFADDPEKLMDKIYLSHVIQDSLKKELGNYTFMQSVNFKKYDSDGEIEEQSVRKYRVMSQSDSANRRDLIEARKYEDGQWQDVLKQEQEKGNNEKNNGEKKEFSMTEIFSKEGRQNYEIRITGNESYKNRDCIVLQLDPYEEDKEKFKGKLWIDSRDYIMVKADLMPSEFPMGVKSMNMNFDMQKIGDLWFAERVYFNAHISFLFIFSGKVESEINFYEYHMK